MIYNNLVIINAFSESGALVALDRKSGDEVWRYDGLKEAWNTPALVKNKDGKTEVVVGIFGKIIGVDPDNGSILWSSKAANWYYVGSPLASDGVVYSLSGKGVESAIAVRAGGKGDVTSSHRLWQTRKGSNVSSAAIHDGRLYFAHEQGSFFYCLDAESGEIVFDERLPRRFGIVYGSPIVADGKVYLFSRQGGSLVLEAGKEYKVISQNPPLDKSAFNSSPAIAGDDLLIRSDETLYCIGSE